MVSSTSKQAMRKTLLRSRWAFAAVSSLLLSGTLTAAEAPVKGTPAPSKEAVLSLAQSSNAFGVDLYKRLSQAPGNLVFSPASITTILTMAWGGAEGETAAQMRTVLHLEGAGGDVLAAQGELARSLQDRSYLFHIANQLFVEKSYPLKPAFVETTKAAFGAPIEALDLKAAPEQARTHINQWVEEKTEHRIKDLIPPGSLNQDSRMVLANAIYFLGHWDSPFITSGTKPAPFHLTTTETKDVPTMHNWHNFLVARRDGVTALALPYRGRAVSMLLLVPDRIDGLADVESSLDAKKIAALVGAMDVENVDLSFPKFEIHPLSSILLSGHLKALGMRLPFDSTQADLSGIAKPPRPEDRLFLAEVFHQAFVRVDEKGTEAAAATVGGVRGAGMELEKKRIQVDRPFLFFIRDNASGLILFMGRVNDPSQQ